MDYKKRSYSNGFTIVELLIVIVVIGILATVTVVAYNGIQARATSALLMSDLVNAQKQMRLFQVENNNFPTTIDCGQADSATNKCIKNSSGVTYQYKVSSVDFQLYCLTATKVSSSYNVNQDGMPLGGPCPVLKLDASNTASYSGSGTVWKDLSGNGNNGTLINGVSYSSTNGGAFGFDGANDYVSIPYNASLNVRDAITLSVWMKRTSGFSQLQDVMILARPPAWYFYDSYNSGSIRGDVYIDGTRRAGLNASVPFDGSWYQITYTYDSNTKTAKIYKNGTQTDSTTLTGLSNYLIDSSTANFANMGYSTSGRTMLLNGASIYNVALSAPEIQQNFDALKGRYGL